MQPVQNITVDDRVSRTQYQYTLEDPDINELNHWTALFVARLKQLPELEDVATDQQPGGSAVDLVIDRATASRLGISPTTIDNTLYDAYGQRQVSTMFTQLNQYHVILELLPGFQRNPTDLRDLYIRTGATTSAAAAGLVPRRPTPSNTALSRRLQRHHGANAAYTTAIPHMVATPASSHRPQPRPLTASTPPSTSFPNGGQPCRSPPFRTSKPPTPRSP